MKMIQLAVLFTLLLSLGCQKIDSGLLGGEQDNQAAIEDDISNLEM